jgi:type VI secretion system ImpJ/VasE family protein
MSTHVHWHEGLFLLPHHLQLMQRGLMEQLRTDRRLGWHYPYGIIESRLLPDELENGRIRFERLRAIMPSGLEIHVPERADLPSLDIKVDLAKSGGALKVYLGVPLWMSNRANSFRPGQEADPRVKLHYRLKEIDREDENTGDNTKPILVRMVNARLMLDHEDKSDMEVLPVLRIQRASERDQDVSRADPKFVPPCLVMGGSPTLRRLVTELSAKVETSRDELVQKLARGGLGAEAKLESTLRLRTLAHFAGSLPGLTESPLSSPFELYLHLRQLLGELAALRPADLDPKSAPYDHDNPLPCFEELDSKIRRGIISEEGRVKKVPFEENANGHPQAAFVEEDFTAPTGYFLGVKTRVERTALATYITDASKFKLMPLSLEGSPIFGLELREENFPPTELPAEPGLYYFHLVKENRRWASFQKDKAAVLEWKRTEFDLSDAKFALYMTLPE